MSVAEARRRISPDEFRDWCLWFSMEPRGDARADYHAAWIAGHVAHSFTGGRWALKDHFLALDYEDNARQTPEDMELIAHAWAVTHNKRLTQKAAKEHK
ncbi:MAG TPA: hypothetical protein VMW48_08820 [Vicinamibacterales bacterium]|nr:hypothetical protein [Vicinamibacterales bacterium]